MTKEPLALTAVNRTPNLYQIVAERLSAAIPDAGLPPAARIPSELVDSLADVLLHIRLATLGEPGRVAATLQQHRRIADALERRTLMTLCKRCANT